MEKRAREREQEKQKASQEEGAKGQAATHNLENLGEEGLKLYPVWSAWEAGVSQYQPPHKHPGVTGI